MTFINDRSKSHRKVVLRNLTSGAPWETEFFELDTSNASFKVLSSCIAEKGKPVGFGSKVVSILRGKPLRIFLAVYFAENEWRFFDGHDDFSLKDLNVRWRRYGVQILSFGVASLDVSSPSGSKSINYFRPWVRHWFEEGWSLDDIDIGWVVSHLSSDADAKARLIQVLGLSE
ncbi:MULTISPECIES: hypothetical protein [unclassified Rhizobacter]|uniref:hypothetical protein n=1 Tax=unclassified Rhizobacter TaxID=2640088 RepID=UPI0012F7ECB8|nr:MULTISPECIES: hypothetical protein [unclassified Rhizobacter]